MAKMSKYKQLIGKVINDVMVVDYERQERVSKKSGKTYKVTRLYVTADGENMLEIGTASFNKMSFLKRLSKITNEWIYKEPVNEPVVEQTPKDKQDKINGKIQDLISKGSWQAMMLAKDVNELNHIYSQLQETVTDEKRYQELGHKYEVILKELQPKMEYYPAVKPMAEFKPVSEIVNSLKDFKAIYDLKELKKAYRQLSKKHHPDLGGNAETFKEMHMNYKKRKYAIKSTTELFEECPEFAEFTTFEEEVDDAMINTNWDGIFEKGEL